MPQTPAPGNDRDHEPTPTTNSQERRRDWIALRVGPIQCGIPLQRVLSIGSIAIQPAAAIGPDALCGGVKYLGKVVPLKDLGASLGFGPIPGTGHTVVLLVSISGSDEDAVTIGLLAERLVGVVQLGASGICPAADGLLSFDRARVIGLGRDPRGQILLLDVDALVTAAERAEAIRFERLAASVQEA